MSSGLWPALEFANDHHSMVDVVNDTGRNPIETNETEASHDLFDRKQFREQLFIAEAILQGQHRGLGTDQLRQQPGKFGVGGGFQGDHHEIGMANLLGRSRAPRHNPEVSLRGFYGNAMAPDMVVIGAEQKVDFVPVATEFRAIETADGTATNDRNFHRKPRLQRKRHPEISECLFREISNYFAPRTASLHALAMRNLTTRLAGMVFDWPLSGPNCIIIWRAGRFTRTSLPRPGRVKVLRACL